MDKGTIHATLMQIKNNHNKRHLTLTIPGAKEAESCLSSTQGLSAFFADTMASHPHPCAILKQYNEAILEEGL